MDKRIVHRRVLTDLIVITIGGILASTAQTTTKGASQCTCRDGRGLEAGFVSYDQNSRRETITRVEAETSRAGSRCRIIWIDITEIRPVGAPFEFYLERTPLKEQRIYGCDYPTERFVKRNKAYEFVFDEDSLSIREMRLIYPNGTLPVPGLDAKSKSNSNLWNSIAAEATNETDKRNRRASEIDPTREFNRTSWVLARKELVANYVGVQKGTYDGEKLVSLKKMRKVKAGQLGQIEAIDGGRAIVRFYEGTRIEKFGKARNAIRRWYDRVGGPYVETKDTLYTPLGAFIVEVSLDDVVEVNDYLDQQKTDKT